jgi:4-amino-4-deoxychorismate lyase
MRSESRPLAVAVLGLGLVDPDVPVIHADDAGLLRGLAAFETLRVYAGRPFAMTEHLERLGLSASRLHLALPPLNQLEALANVALTGAATPECSLRFTVTGGRPGTGPVAMAMILALPDDLEEVRARGIGVIALQLGTDPRVRRDSPWLLDGVKSTSYAVNMAAWDEARRRGAEDAVFLATDGSVLEGPVTNVWWRHGSTLFTPSLELGILAGVTRAYVIRVASTLGFEVQDGAFPLSHLAGAEEAFSSSSVRELMPIVKLDGKAVGSAAPGDGTMALQAALREAARA